MERIKKTITFNASYDLNTLDVDYYNIKEFVFMGHIKGIPTAILIELKNGSQIIIHTINSLDMFNDSKVRGTIHSMQTIFEHIEQTYANELLSIVNKEPDITKMSSLIAYKQQSDELKENIQSVFNKAELTKDAKRSMIRQCTEFINVIDELDTFNAHDLSIVYDCYKITI